MHKIFDKKLGEFVCDRILYEILTLWIGVFYKFVEAYSNRESLT